MRKIIYLSVIALFCIMVLTACDKKQHAIENLTEFVDKVEKNAPEYTDEDWKEINKEYDELMAEIDKYDYSFEESKQIGELQGRLAAIKVKDTGRDAIEGAQKAYVKWLGILKGFWEEIKDIFGNSINMPPFVNDIDSSENLGFDRVATDLKGAIDGLTKSTTND